MGDRSNVRPFRKPLNELAGVDLVARFEGSTIAPLSSAFDQALVALASPACDVKLTKGDRTRRYHIREGRDVSEWYCQVWFGTAQHRGDRVLGVVPAQRLLAQYRREIAELVTDGWAVTS